VKIERLLEALPEQTSSTDEELIRRAYEVAKKAHKGQKRASGEPYINHCLAVAIIMAELGAPTPTIVAALLHDSVEDTDLTLDDLKHDFGSTHRSKIPRQDRPILRRLQYEPEDR